MTSISTQSNLASSSVITTAFAAFRNQSTSESIKSNNSLELIKTTLTLSSDTQKEDTTPFDPEKGGLDPRMQPLLGLAIMGGEEQSKMRDKEAQEYSAEPMAKADAAFSALNTQLLVLQHKIEAIKPDLLGKKWDFVLKGDKIEVTGALKADEKQWLENSLNRNKVVLNAVKDVYASVVKAYEHTQDHPSAIANENGVNRFAYGVEEQINGKLPLRDLMTQATKNNSDALGPMLHPFMDAIELSRQYIKTSNQSVYSVNRADMSDATTAAFMREHPDYRI